MRKFAKRAAALALAGLMTVGTAGAVLADPTPTPTPAAATSDTDKITLTKYYQLGGTSGNNTSTFYFKISPYGVWNAGSSTGAADGAAYTSANMPAFTSDTGSVTVATGATANVDFTLPSYNSVGDFWYLVQETATNVTSTDTDALRTNAAGLKNTGVIYGTNDGETENTKTLNFSHSGKYYLHVQVVNNTDTTATPKLLRSVTLHKIAPQQGINNTAYTSWAGSISAETNKVANIQNKYFAGSLSVKKEVEGNAADKDKRFEVTVVFTKPEGGIINSAITYHAVAAATGTGAIDHTINGQTVANNNWKKGSGDTATETDLEQLTNTVKFYIKAGETVTFNNIPYGVTYTVTESDPNNSSDSYQNKIATTEKSDATSWSGKTFTADQDSPTYSADFTKHAAGSITDESDIVTITNKKDSSIDIGVITSNTPYVAMLAVLAGAAALFIFRRRKNSEV